MWYGVLALSSIMFGFMFFFKQMYSINYKEENTIRAMAIFNFIGGIIGIISLLIVNGFRFEYTHFSLIMAVISTINTMLFSFCSLKAFGKINLSLYSVFSMLCGMALPFAAGILFYDEPLTLGKGLCFAIITLALFLTVEKREGKSGWIYYAGVFICNGMAGVISKAFQAAPFEKTSSAGYSILCSVCGLAFGLILVIIYKPSFKKLNWKVLVGLGGSNALSRIANWMILVALSYLPASAQYPFITGGTMVVSTVIAYVTHQHPSKKEIAAVALSVVAMVIVALVP